MLRYLSSVRRVPFRPRSSIGYWTQINRPPVRRNHTKSADEELNYLTKMSVLHAVGDPKQEYFSDKDLFNSPWKKQNTPIKQVDEHRMGEGDWLTKKSHDQIYGSS